MQVTKKEILHASRKIVEITNQGFSKGFLFVSVSPEGKLDVYHTLFGQPKRYNNEDWTQALDRVIYYYNAITYFDLHEVESDLFNALHLKGYDISDEN